MPDEPKQPDFAAMSAPAPAHERLTPFVGTFRAEVKIWMGPGDPNLSTGKMTNTFALGGRFLRQEYKGDPNDGPFPEFEGHGYWGFNKATGKYEGFWIDNASTIMQTDAGDVDDSGKRWEMKGEMVGPNGDPLVKRSVITLEDDDHHSIEMFFIHGDQESRAMEIRYTRSN